MKKKISALLLTILFILPLKVNALEMDSYIDWELDRSIFVHQLRNGEDHVTNLAMIKANDVSAYCIEPGVLADKASMYNSTDDVSVTPLGNVDTRYISLVGYYGYGYQGHNTKEYYMAAQELIWRHMGVDDVWFSDAKVGGNVINVNVQKDEIMKLVNSYETFPEFNIKDNYIVGDTVVLNDKNSVLNDYEVSYANTKVSIDNNSLNINIKQYENNFTLSRKNGKNKVRFYYKKGYQTIASFEGAYNFSKDYSLNGVFGKIIVDKLDFDTNTKEVSSPFASLAGAVYTLYDVNDKKIISKSTDEKGMVIFDNLPKGNYTVRENSPSKGYNLNQEVNRTFLGSNQLSITLTSCEKIIKKKIIINKVLDDEENKLCIPEKDIEFGVYDVNGNFVNSYFTDTAGNIEFFLPYGEYVIKQLTTPEGVDKIEDFVVKVTDDLEEKFSLINKKTEKPKETLPKEEMLPKTGKQSSIVFIALANLFSLLGISYGKKHS